MQVKFSELPYFKDGAECFAHFAYLPYAVFLDGCQPFDLQERYSIIAANPRILITSTNTDIFSQIRTHLYHLRSTIQIPAACQHLPFRVGAIGYFSYDLARRYFPLKTQTIHDIMLPVVVIGIYDWSLVIDHHEKKTWVITLDDEQLKYINTQLSTPLVDVPFKIFGNFQSNMTFREYTIAFQKIQHHIQQGDCYQVNLSQRFSATYFGSPWTAYRYLRRINPTPFSIYFNLNNNQAILSFSPERFLRIKNRNVETKPIKGTAPRFKNLVDDAHSAKKLLHSVKDHAENLMIVDLLRNDLGKCCKPGTIHVPKLAALESFPNIHHLVSTVTGQLRDNQDALDVLRHCFPGGSITGAPKLRAMQIIEVLEPHHRSVYCGTIGYIDINGNLDCNIAIRTLICDRNHMYCYAGGGIVADSILENEYEESKIKVQRLIHTLSKKLKLK
ncbi:aminodeoxychorismate synthase component I [Coxiella endosymbiont of Amblyomma nuttalli]|uniref:aminodeoxychorismate synthase component I n=1 Tax=Coxiella endosymbiont of Amblyomma nuttalli TaxID=2749996 RepID=UPI001BAC8CA0|nr:aminodeoxychorismate synthase component I [Coxiella endosymbiont of Amblyomma nuttalli]QTS83845.1 Aminodeoxychorismate synthase component 1 [Coxiella endosymbiont of Amblyomma nuttalli]